MHVHKKKKKLRKSFFCILSKHLQEKKRNLNNGKLWLTATFEKEKTYHQRYIQPDVADYKCLK